MVIPGLKRLNGKALFLWRLRLTLCMLPLPVLVAMFFGALPVWNGALTCLWIAFYLFMFLFYYPVKWAKLSYGVNERAFIVYCGVFYNRIKAMEVDNVQIVTSAASPAERLLRLSTLFVRGAGGMIRVPSMPADDAAWLSRRLARADREEADG